MQFSAETPDGAKTPQQDFEAKFERCKPLICDTLPELKPHIADVPPAKFAFFFRMLSGQLRSLYELLQQFETDTTTPDEANARAAVFYMRLRALIVDKLNDPAFLAALIKLSFYFLEFYEFVCPTASTSTPQDTSPLGMLPPEVRQAAVLQLQQSLQQLQLQSSSVDASLSKPSSLLTKEAAVAATTATTPTTSTTSPSVSAPHGDESPASNPQQPPQPPQPPQ